MLGGVALLVLVMVIFEGPMVWKLNGQLEDNETLAAYPYPYRVLDFRNGVATLSTPHADDAGAARAIRALFPALADAPDDSPRLAEALLEMARMRAIAAEVVISHPDVGRVDWMLDRRWLNDNGIDAGPP